MQRATSKHSYEQTCELELEELEPGTCLFELRGAIQGCGGEGWTSPDLPVAVGGARC